MPQITRFPQTVKGVSERLSGFMQHLRHNGIVVNIPEHQLTLQAFSRLDITCRRDVQMACKAICVGRSDHFEKFDELFNAYWLNSGSQRFAVTDTASNKRKSKSIFQPGVNESLQSSEHGDASDADSNSEDDAESAHSGEGQLIASTIKNIEKTDLREMMTPDNIKKAERLAYQLAAAMRDRRSRRRRAARRGAMLDLRKVIRASISRGGEPFQLYKRHKPDRPVNIVALLDVSGSMTVYAKVFLAFLKGLVSHDQRTDAYLFHTSLVRVSDALRDNDSLRAVNRLSLMAQGFGGGTKIGTNLPVSYTHLTLPTKA